MDIMDSDTQKQLILDMGTALYDEGQIVTYKTLSKNLNIHVNLAKQLLQKFKDGDKEDLQKELCYSYLLSGVKDDGTHVLIVTNEEDLKTVRKTMKVSCEHIYSVQRMTRVKNFDILYAADKVPVERYISPIKCALSQQQGHKKNAENSQKAVTFNIKEKPVPAPSQDRPQRKSITSMFQHSLSSIKAGGSTHRKSKEESPKAGPSHIENKKGGTPPHKKIDKKEFRKKINVEEKKRKRIQVLSDSDSDSEAEEQRERSPSPEPLPEPEETAMKEESDEEKIVETNQSGPKRKKRKLVDKHVINDDGYMETTKDMVYVTDSEGESEKKSPKPKTSATKVTSEAKKVPAVLAASPKKGKGKGKANDGKKQTSLFTFFLKK